MMYCPAFVCDNKHSVSTRFTIYRTACLREKVPTFPTLDETHCLKRAYNVFQFNCLSQPRTVTYVTENVQGRAPRPTLAHRF